MKRFLAGVLAALSLIQFASVSATAQTEKCADLTDNSSPIEYRLGAPTETTAKRLLDQIDYQRAIQMYLWGLPAVGTQQYRLANAKAMGGSSDDWKVAYLGGLLKASLLHLTGNPDSMYIDYFFDTHSGPIVLEVPPELPGFLDDMWERPIIDVIAPVSLTGKYLIVPPDWNGTAPDGFVVARPKTYASWLLLRGNVSKDGTTAAAVDLMKEKLKIYPLSELGKQPGHPLQFFDITQSRADRLPPDGLRYFEVLADLVTSETTTMQDPYVMGMLKAIGMEPGKPFQPDLRMKHILTCAAEMGNGMASTLTYFKPDPQWADRKFTKAFIGGSPEFTVNGAALHDARTFFFYAACGTSKLMTSTTPGVGQAYPSGVRDGDGNFLDGGKTYKLHLPPQVPAKLYWSITLYDNTTRSMLDNGTPAARVSSFTGPVANSDGSYDLYFGPMPSSGRETNFVKTVPGKGWFFLFRLYGPEQAYFNGAWRPDDLIEVAN
jgi:hypothetical protein